MAKEDDLELDVDTNSSKSSKSKSRLFLIIGLVLCLLGASAGAAWYFTNTLNKEKETEEASSDSSDANEDKSVLKEPLSYVPLDPPFVVNFGDDSEIRFLQVTIELGTRDVSMVDQIKEHRPAIRNSLVMLFSSQEPQILNTRPGKEKLRSETLLEVQKVLEEETGDPGVENVFFTSFVMQ